MSVLTQKSLTTNTFKKKYPRLFNKIIRMYGGRENIFDVAAAIELALKGIPPPCCEVCGVKLSITKKFRNTSGLSALRCSKHVNTSTLVSVDKIQAVLPENISVVGDLPEKFSPTTEVVLECREHGQYKQLASYILNGGKCQQCYHESRGPRFSTDQWINKANAAHNNKYDYSATVFNGVEKDVTIVCPIHGEFVQNAGVHIRGHGCPKCANDQASVIRTLTTEEFIQRAKTKHLDTYNYSLVDYTDSRQLVNIICKKHGQFQQVAYYHLAGNGCPKCGMAMSTFKSAAEYEILEFLKENGIKDAVHSDQSLGVELDILIPSSNLAIEYNGVYWHSSGSKATDAKRSKQHLLRTELCERNGISLLHILDLEWNDPIKREIWKSTILHKLGKSRDRIYARKCSIVLVSHKKAVEFFNENHLQGAATSSLCIGLQYNGQLVAVGAFAKARFSKKKNTYELIRFASLRHLSVVGGFMRIIKEFARSHSGNLISYANRRWSQGNVYKATGFELESISGPCYYYTDCKQLWHRSVFQKHKLSAVLAQYDKTKSEVDNMYENKYRRIWDCGHMVFKIDLDTVS